MSEATHTRVRSSMESFLDEYQLVRIGLGLSGLAYIGVVVVAGLWNERLNPIVVVLLVVTAHALWCRLRRIRSPRVMLLLDLTLWGWVMSLPVDKPTVATASFAFLALLTVLFADGYWSPIFLVYVTGWYGYAYFSDRPVDADSISEFTPVVFTMACLAVVVYYVTRWLGRLDANRSQMMGTVSHELRNNLTGMIGVTDLVLSTDELSTDQVGELIRLANQQAVDAAEIVEDLLTASRLESSAMDVNMTPVDVNAEVNTTVRRFAGEGTDVSVDATPELSHASADALRVRQILRNLISNAVRYGGPTISVSTQSSGERVEVIVRDDGEGVPPKEETTIFLPYRRSTASRRAVSSVGLGLWICKQLAGAMGGDLTYTRENDLTEFTLILRLDTSDDARHAALAATALEVPVLLE